MYANMLECNGIHVEDYDIALGMELPCMAAEIKKLQQAYIDAAFKNKEKQIRLADSLDMGALRKVFDDWIELIQRRIKKMEV